MFGSTGIGLISDTKNPAGDVAPAALNYVTVDHELSWRDIVLFLTYETWFCGGKPRPLAHVHVYIPLAMESDCKDRTKNLEAQGCAPRSRSVALTCPGQCPSLRLRDWNAQFKS